MASAAPFLKTLGLPEHLDLRAATPLATDLLALRGENVAIDASRVTKVGAQCVQVLLSAAATWRQDQARFEIVNASTEFVEGIGSLGIAPATLSNQETSR